MSRSDLADVLDVLQPVVDGGLGVVEKILSRRPHLKLLAAMQGRLGLELAEQHLPDLVILDLHLPDVPSSEVLARRRTAPATAGIPVIVLRADATKGQVDRLLEAGAQAYLTKPLDVQCLLELIDEHLRARRSANAERTSSQGPSTSGMPSPRYAAPAA